MNNMAKISLRFKPDLAELINPNRRRREPRVDQGLLPLSDNYWGGAVVEIRPHAAFHRM